MAKYCGYEIGKDITIEQLERLFHFIHANFTKKDLIMLSQEQLNHIARVNEREWK